MTDIRVGVVDVYVIRPYRADWLVLSLQRSSGTRCPGSWAVREVREETGLELDRLYNVTCQPFYLHTLGVVEMAVVFAAFVTERADVRLGAEHQRFEWLSMTDAAARFTWPREREALEHIRILLGTGDAGPAEDVLRVV